MSPLGYYGSASLLNLIRNTGEACVYLGVSHIRQAYPFVCLSEIKRIYDGTEAETRKSQARFQIIQVSNDIKTSLRFPC